MVAAVCRRIAVCLEVSSQRHSVAGSELAVNWPCGCTPAFTMERVVTPVGHPPRQGPTEQLSCLDRAISCADSTIRHSTPSGRTWSRAVGAACCFEISNSRRVTPWRDATAPSPTATWPHKAHKQAGREQLISIHPYLRAKVTPSPPLLPPPSRSDDVNKG